MMNVPDTPLRLNISARLNGPALDYARRVNTSMQSYGAAFAFEPAGVAIPHLTLLMGDVASGSDYAALCEIVRAMAPELASYPYALSAPFYADRKRKWVFAAVESDARLTQFRLNLASALNGLLSFDDNGGPLNAPHVTLAYLDDRCGKPMAPLTHDGSSDIVQYVQIARTGPHGTCVEALKVFDLRSLSSAEAIA